VMEVTVTNSKTGGYPWWGIGSRGWAM